MAEKAVRLDPDSAEALARVAELRMAEGDTRGAKEAAAAGGEGHGARSIVARWGIPLRVAP